MIQAWALLVDSYRELKSRSLFWISLVVSALVAISLFGGVSFDETGYKLLWTHIEDDNWRAGSQGARDLMAWLFSGIYVFWWLSWGAIILAIVSTASILPGFLSSGSIDISLAKPIGRFRLFAMKIIGALLFVLLQTTLSVVLALVLVGIKVSTWSPAILWAIPLIVIQFFYLYSFSALVAVVTRSTLATLLMTMLFWVVASFVQIAVGQVDQIVVQADIAAAQTERQVTAIRDQAAANGRAVRPVEAGQIARLEVQRDQIEKQAAPFRPWIGMLKSAEVSVPKTRDIQKIISNLVEAPTLQDIVFSMNGVSNAIRPPSMTDAEWEMLQETGKESEDVLRDINVAESIGTSLGMSFAVLGVAAFLFWRKDF